MPLEVDIPPPQGPVCHADPPHTAEERIAPGPFYVRMWEIDPGMCFLCQAYARRVAAAIDPHGTSALEKLRLASMTLPVTQESTAVHVQIAERLLDHRPIGGPHRCGTGGSKGKK